MIPPVSSVPRTSQHAFRPPARVRVRRGVACFRADESGATSIEYGLIVGLVFLAIVGAVHLFADRMALMYNYIGTNIHGS